MRIGALVAAAAVVVAACGADDDGADDGGASGTLPPATEPSVPATSPPANSGEYTYPTAPADVVVSYSEDGGFTTRAFAVQNLPQIVITGDGRVLTPGATIAIFPGPLLPPVFERTITDDGIQAVLAAAEDAGLLAELDLSSEAADFVADATTANVIVSADGSTWVHSAYALGIGGGPDGGDETPNRAGLQDFLAQLGDLEALVGADQLGPEAPFEPTEYRIFAFPIDDPNAMASDGMDVTVVEWPTDAPVRLADAEQCVLAPADAVGELFTDADQLTFFEEDGVGYEVLPTPMLPGLGCP